MKGMISYCSICGIQARKLGVPSMFDECRDIRACLERVIQQKDFEIAEKTEQIQKLQRKLLDK